jgi:hypothetical protein
MQILQEHEVRKLVKTNQDRQLTVEELREELEWYWDRKLQKGTRIPLLMRRVVPDSAIPGGHGIAQRNP